MIYILGLVIIFTVLCVVNKVKIKWRTFLKKGFLPKRGDFGVYCYCGKQGTGKTYSVVEYLQDNKDKITVFCNIGDITGLEYFHFTGFDELIKLKKIIDFPYSDNGDELRDYIASLGFSKQRTKEIWDQVVEWKVFHTQLVFVYDEIFTELQKQSKINKEVMDFLCQMRKREIIFLTTAQEWVEIPITFRRFCRFQIDCKMYNFLVIGILLKHFKDAENMKWSNEEQEHIAPLVSNTVTKARKSISNSYNTKLRICSVAPEAPSTAPTGETVE